MAMDNGRWTKRVDFLFSTSNGKIAFHLWCHQWSLKLPPIQSKEKEWIDKGKMTTTN